MSEYIEWLKDYDKSHITHPSRQDCFEAGQQSQQAKIDLLEKELTETQAFLNKQNHIKQAKIDELQGRIDESLVQVNNHKHSCEARKRLKRMTASVSEIAEIEAHESNMYVLENILEGNKDEN